MASGTGYNKMFPVSWTELHRDARALAWRLADVGPFKGLVAITRGGLVPAAIVARELNLRLIDTICCSTYDRMERGARVETLKGSLAEQEKGKGWLIVDDLVEADRLRTQQQVAVQAGLGLRHAPVHEQRRDVVDEAVLRLAQWLVLDIRHVSNMMK